MATAKQIAARKLFAARSKAGLLTKRPKASRDYARDGEVERAEAALRVAQKRRKNPVQSIPKIKTFSTGWWTVLTAQPNGMYEVKLYNSGGNVEDKVRLDSRSEVLSYLKSFNLIAKNAKRKTNPNIRGDVVSIYKTQSGAVALEIRSTDGERFSAIGKHGAASGSHYATMKSAVALMLKHHPRVYLSEGEDFLTLGDRIGARRINPLTRVKVKSPSYRTGAAPSKRLVARRKATKAAPSGYYANPANPVKTITSKYQMHLKRGASWITSNYSTKRAAVEICDSNCDAGYKCFVTDKSGKVVHDPYDNARLKNPFVVDAPVGTRVTVIAKKNPRSRTCLVNGNNPVGKSKSKLPANFPYVVQHKNTGTGNWNTDAAFKSMEQAADYAHALAKSYPRLTIRVNHYTGGAM